MRIQLSPELAAESAKAEKSRALFEAERARQTIEREAEAASTPIPVEVDGEYDVTVTGTSDRGDGIAKIDGFVVFVPHAEQGWQGKVKVSKLLQRAAVAKKVVEPMPLPEKGEEYDITITGVGRDEESGVTKINGVVTFVKGAPNGWQGKVRVTGVGKSGRVVFAERTDMPASPSPRRRISASLLGEDGAKKKRDVSREKTRAYKLKRAQERPAKLLNQAFAIDNQFCVVCNFQTVAMKDVNGNIVTTMEELAAARELGPVTRVKLPHEGAHSPVLGIVPPAPKPTTKTRTTRASKPKAQTKKTETRKQPTSGFIITEPSFAIPGAYFDTRNNKVTDTLPRFLPYGDNAVLTTIANRPGSKIPDLVDATGLSVAEVKAELDALSDKLDVTRKGRHFIRGQNDVRAKRVDAAPKAPAAHTTEALTEELMNVATLKVDKHVLSNEAYSMFMDSIVYRDALPTFIAQDGDAQKRTLAELGFVPFAEGCKSDELLLTPIVAGSEKNPLYYYPVGGNQHDGCLMKGTKNCFHLRVITTDGKLPQTKAAMIDDYGFYKQAYVPVRENDTVHFIDGEFRNGKPTITSYNAFIFTDFRDGHLVATRNTQCNPAEAINNLVRLQAIKGMTTPYTPHKGHYYANVWQPRTRTEQVQEAPMGGPQASPGSAGRN